jgi:putative effector of murein hydrolase LrgA (UPF0299 family)
MRAWVAPRLCAAAQIVPLQLHAVRSTAVKTGLYTVTNNSLLLRCPSCHAMMQLLDVSANCASALASGVVASSVVTARLQRHRQYC